MLPLTASVPLVLLVQSKKELKMGVENTYNKNDSQGDFQVSTLPCRRKVRQGNRKCSGQQHTAREK